MSFIPSIPVATLSVFLLSACASSSGTNPGDMTAAEHNAASESETKEAERHEAQFDQNEPGTSKKCSLGEGRACWTDSVNPTSFAVDIRSSAPGVAAEVWRRAQELSPVR